MITSYYFVIVIVRAFFLIKLLSSIFFPFFVLCFTLFFLVFSFNHVDPQCHSGHREKMRLIGKEHLLEPLNKNALIIAKKVAAEGDALVAGNISNTNIYNPKDEKSWVTVRAMFDEQVSTKSFPL